MLREQLILLVLLLVRTCFACWCSNKATSWLISALYRLKISQSLFEISARRNLQLVRVASESEPDREELGESVNKVSLSLSERILNELLLQAFARTSAEKSSGPLIPKQNRH